MRKIIALAAILTATVPSVALSVDGSMPAPLPGPYQFMMIPQPNYVQPTPYAAPQTEVQPQGQQSVLPYWMQAPRQQLPYWMQAPQGQPQPFANSAAVPYGSQGNASANTEIGGQTQGGFNFNAQARSNNTFNQGYGQSAGPSYFPGYGGSTQAPKNMPPQQNTRPVQQQPAPNFQGYPAAPYPAPQGMNGPWNGNSGTPWGGQSFGPWGPGFPTGWGLPTWWGR